MDGYTQFTDTLIIGSGIAGGAAALHLSENPQHHVTVLTRAADPHDSNSSWAQGGIVTRGMDDQPELLVEDILHAGAGISSKQAASILAAEGPQLVQSVLIERCGVQFDRAESGELYYGLEAAHSARRIVHVGDKTGAAIVNGLLRTLARRENVTLLTEHTALDLITQDGTCAGAYVLDRQNDSVLSIYSHNTILATGGVGQIFENTTNPAGARGDGVAMAYRAGAKITNAEYMQFHPTALKTSTRPNLLISEAVRGEGAILRTPDGEAFMAHYAPEWKDLAPRDVVARAIHHEMQIHGYDHVFLDIASQRPAAFIRQRFPQLVENCAKLGLDPTIDPLPVSPAAHYFCGGVQVDAWGRSGIDKLYTVGEVSCTGLHGANRLASTSLLEGLVWGDRAARDIQHNAPAAKRINHQTHDSPWLSANRPAPAAQWIETRLSHLRQIMWHDVGLVRRESNLQRAETAIQALHGEVKKALAQTHPNDATVALRNSVQTAALITQAARRNRSSRGTHYRDDVPQTQTAASGAMD